MLPGTLGARASRDRLFQSGRSSSAGAVLAAGFAPWLPPFDPRAGDLRNAYPAERGGRYLPGTDTRGRDGPSRVLSRVPTGRPANREQ